MQRRAALASLALVACGASPRARSVPLRERGSGVISRPGERALFRRHPALAEALPWARLAELPTPVESAPALAERLGLGALYVKRDDRSAEAYGGNKVRKLEFLLGAALAENKREVLTFGGVGSNHALATAVHARRLGLGAILLLLPQAKSREVRHNLLAAIAHGAELHGAHSVDEAIAAAPYQKRDPYLIPTGGTSPLGDVGLVDAGLEIAEQVRAGILPEPDEIWLALGTAGTAAGIAMGVAAGGLRSRVSCVRVSSPRYGSFRNVARAFARTHALLRAMEPSFAELSPDAERIRVVDGFAGAGYGLPSAPGRRAKALVEELAGLELDDTYTAKTFAALSRAPGRVGKTVLFYDSYDARRIAPDHVDLARVPSELRGYVL